MKNSKPVLLIEDDNVDAMAVKRAFTDLKITNQLVCADNGKAALDHLKNGCDKKPCIIILDLNMPKMNGFEFLEAIKSDNMLKQIPVIILTTSNDKKDKVKTFKSSVAGYVVKPANYTNFLEAVKTINLYWTLSETSD
jgi:CheY-like chemotaxis protein